LGVALVLLAIFALGLWLQTRWPAEWVKTADAGLATKTRIDVSMGVTAHQHLGQPPANA
jgi:hypothetical protein